MRKSLLLIFVKHPIAGQVKTRLVAGVGQAKALTAYQRLLAYTLSVVQSLDCDKAVFYGNEIPPEDLWSEAGFPRFLQQGPDLGSRMLHAFAWAFGSGYEKVMIIGSDNAEISASVLQEGLTALDDVDVVIGPAKDGGYYCLGTKELIPAVFESKSWSTSSVYADTVRDLDRLGKSYQALPTLRDIDTKEDLSGTFLADLL